MKTHSYRPSVLLAALLLGASAPLMAQVHYEDGKEQKESKRDTWKQYVGQPDPSGWRANVIQPDPNDEGPDGFNYHDWDGDGDLDVFVNFEEGGYSRLYFNPGKAIYDSHCLNCHQANAKGLPGIYPPLAGSEWVTGDKDALIKMLLHGLSGPISVKGEPYGTGNPIPMPPSGLDDRKIAGVLSYIRSDFGNRADAVTTEEVRILREKHKDRTTLWTVPELTSEK